MVIGSDDVVVISAERRGHLSGDSLPSLDELRAGDETAYERLVTVFSPWMQRIARKHVQSAGLAEDIVQETWLAVLSGLDAFQGRSSLKTWIFQILVNQAKSAGRHERRVIAMNPLAAVATLPPRDAKIIALRDIQGLSAPEAAEQLGISDGNQRVLLHRARVRLRAMLGTCTEDQTGRTASGQSVKLTAAAPPCQRSKTPRQSRSQGPVRPRQMGRPTAGQASVKADPCLTPFTGPRRRPP